MDNRNIIELATESPNVEMPASETARKACRIGEEMEPTEEGMRGEEIQEAATNEREVEDKASDSHLFMLSSNWSDGAWFDPNDPRPGLSPKLGSSPEL